jgi:glucokinase
MKRVAAGIDIGGTNTAIGLVDEHGNLLGEGVLPTSKYPDFNGYIEELTIAIKELAKSLLEPMELVGIGIGAPNANYYHGTIENAANLQWKGILPIAADMQRYFAGIPIVATNDANAAAIGEMTYGGAKGMKDFVEVTLGTGIGSGFVTGGKLLYGHDSFAGELGHIIVRHINGRECGCGRKGCLETYASATGIKRTVFKLLADSMEPSDFRGISFNDMSAEMITQSALAGDKLAIAAFEHTGMMLGRALADMVAITSPEAIFLFGGLAKAGKYLFEPTKRYMEENLLYNYKGKVALLPSALDGCSAAVLGASALVWDELK